ncbi:MAG: dienelactone hydrolase family protein [Chloroflexota bacterium]|nr:dienelactone hydrolase family protein [Chloroflexota bacterium]
MCFAPDARPPIAAVAGAALDGRRIELASRDGTRFMAFAARAESAAGAAILILPDVRGLHRYYEELALRFAEAGVDALAMDYFGRTTPVADRPTDFDHRLHIAQTRYPTLVDDVSTAVDHLRSSTGAGSVFSIGFCFGGRLSFLAATRPELGLAGVIGFYGWPVGSFRAGMPAPADVAAEMRCPVLAIFGGADEGIPGDDVEHFRSALVAAGVEHEIVVYPGASHSFFDRKAEEFADASADAWRRVLDFVRQSAAVR